MIFLYPRWEKVCFLEGYSPSFESYNPSRMARTVNPAPCWQLPCEAPVVAAGPCALPSLCQAVEFEGVKLRKIIGRIESEPPSFELLC